MKLSTKRLILRQIHPEDAKSLVEQINNLEISKWLLKVPHPYTLKDARWFINHVAKKVKKKPGEDYDLAVQIKRKPGVIGGMGIYHIDKDQGTAHLGYWIGQDHWRQGYAKEGVQELMQYAFDRLRLRRLIIPAFAGNEGSNGLAKSLGFTYEGRLRKEAVCKATGKIHDENIWGLLRSEWKKRVR